MRKALLLIVGILVFLGGCAALMEKANSQKPAEVVSGSVSESETAVAASDEIAWCQDMVATSPGDTAFVLEIGWVIKCVQRGDEALGDTGDTHTFGYADPEAETIYLEAESATPEILVHEAAHVVDFVSLSDKQRFDALQIIGADDWWDGETYWKFPGESFAESRARCLGYEADPEFQEMSCDLVDELISQSSKAEMIEKSVKSAT